MTTTNISIQDLVQREVIYCVSSLVYTLTQENKLEEELAIELWTAPIDYGAAKYGATRLVQKYCKVRGTSLVKRD